MKMNARDSGVERGGEMVQDSVETYFRYIGEFEVMPHCEVIRLSKRFRRTGDLEAREKLILHNLRFVVTLAKPYLGYGLDFLELIQEGNLGLIKAVERFNPSFGCRFTTYARWWIRQGIARAVSKYGKTIRLPIHVLDRRRKVLRINEGLTEKLGRRPTETELSLAAKEPAEFIKQCFAPVFTIPLQTPLSPDSADTIGDTIPDMNAVSPSERAEQETLAACIEEALRTLTEREQVVLKHRFGFLNDGSESTLEEVGKKLKVTRERIRQIESKALRKLRMPSRLRLLRGESELTPADLDGSAWEKDLIRFRKPMRKRTLGAALQSVF